MSKARKRSIIVSLMVAMFLGAVEGTVVTTAMPTIASDLNGFAYISMVFSSYLLTSAISTPIYGKLSDLYGRKKMLIIGIAIFLTGSALCGLSQTMGMLIGFRALQGLGTGAIFTVTYTIVGDLFSLEERPKIQGTLSSVWGIASLIGPFLGGVLIDSFSWHWIFFINLPFGILCIFLLEKNLKDDFIKQKHEIDYPGIFVLSLAIIVFINIFEGVFIIGEQKVLFNIVSIVVTLLLLAAFYKIERKASEPIIAFEIFTKSSVMVNTISFFVSAILISMDVYLPIYIQNVLGYSPKISGLSLAPMSISWILASFALGKGMKKFGARKMVLISNTVLFVGVLFLFQLHVSSALFWVIAYTFILGFAFGGAFTTLTIMVQESVEMKQRGSAMAANSLLRTLGQTIGISIFGLLFNQSIVAYFEKRNIFGINPDNLYKEHAQLVKISVVQIKNALNSSLHIVYLALFVLATISILLSLVLQKKRNVEVN